MSGHLLKRVVALFLCLILFTSSVSASVTIHFSEDETVTVRKEESASPSEGESVRPENETEDHTEADPEYPSTLTKDAKGIETEAETENIYDETEAEIYMPAQTFTENTGTVFVVVNAPSGAFPDGTSMSVKDVEDQETLSTIEEAVSSRVSQIHAVDITFSDRDGREIEPLLPINVILTAEEKNRYFVKFNLEGLLRGDYQSRMNGYATARQNGWMSANDIRELENLDRIPAEDGGDLYLINGNMLPLVHAGAFADIDSGKEDTESDEPTEEILEVEKSGRRRTGSTSP